MAAHYDAAGGGLDRFQPIVTPDSYPGEHYDSTLGIHLSVGDREGFSDRFWDREIDSQDISGGRRGAFLPEAHSSVRSPLCPRCKLPRLLEAQLGKGENSPRLPAIDGVYSTCCCPDIRLPNEKEMMSHHFLRRHSSLWEKGQLSPDLEVVCEEDTNTADLIGEKSIQASMADPFPAKNMPLGGQSIDSLEGHAGGQYEELDVVEGVWAHRSKSSSEGLDGVSSVVGR